MKSPVYVMHIIDSMKFGGAEVLLRDLTRGLLNCDYRVSVRYSTPGPISDEIAAMGVSVLRFPRLGRQDPFLLWRMWRDIRREKPDIVHTHLFKSDFHGRFAARLAGVPVVISTLHNFDRWAKNPILGGIYGLTARLADKIIAVSQEVQEYAVQYGLCPSEQIATIQNGISFERFQKNGILGEKLRQEFHIPQDAPLLGIVARLSEQKDHVTFLQAATQISRERPTARFLIVGDGPLRQELQDLSVSLGLGQSVIFCGSRSDMQSIYSALDILVFSSRWEGLPVALLEGMAAELPVVATNVGGIPGVVKAMELGRLVPPGSPAELAKACVELIDDPILRKRMGAAASAHVKSRYGMDAMVNAIDRLYQSLLSEVGA